MCKSIMNYACHVYQPCTIPTQPNKSGTPKGENNTEDGLKRPTKNEQEELELGKAGSTGSAEPIVF